METEDNKVEIIRPLSIVAGIFLALVVIYFLASSYFSGVLPSKLFYSFWAVIIFVFLVGGIVILSLFLQRASLRKVYKRRGLKTANGQG